MKRIVLIISILCVLPLLLFACGNDGIDLDAIDIEAIDRIDVPAGTYTIQYAVEDMSNLVKNHGAIVSFEVKNSQNEEINVSGATFTVIAHEVYTVKIRLTIGDTYKEKTITVTATTQTGSVLVNFHLNGGSGSFPALTIDYHSKINFTSTPIKDGFTFEGWYYEEDFQTLYRDQLITSHLTLYAKWEQIVIETAVVSFELQGGSGSFTNQTIQLGSYAIEPNGEPTRQGYTFLGWYTSPNGTENFDFETMTIYANTIIYAQWQELILTDTYTVTYLLNGAFQPEPITEEVEKYQSPLGPKEEFIYANHLFQGWSEDENAEVPTDLSTFVVTEDLTLYAVWHIDFDVIDGMTYIYDHRYENKSTLNEGYVEQRYHISAYIQMHAIENDFSITEDRVDYGIIVSTSILTPTYYSLDSKRITKTFSKADQSMTNHLFEILTEPLSSDTTYYIISYVRFEHTIVYSDVITLHTYIQVPEGTAVGANYVVSGGYYKYDSNSTSFRPSTFIEILDGFEAKLDDLNYSSYSQLYREGIRRLITKEISTGKEYLHVFNLDFQTPHVILTFAGFVENGNEFKPKYEVVFPFVEDINYPVSELGILYSKEHPFLKLDIPNVSKKKGGLESEENTFTLNNAIDVSRDDVYIRGYAIINGKTSYSRYITKLVYNNTTSLYETAETIDTTELKTSPEYGTSSNYTPATMRVYKVTGDTITYTDYPNSFELLEEGQYFVRNINGTGMIDDILIIDDFPEVTGVTELGQYVDSVFIAYDMFNPTLYYSLNDGPYVDLPSEVRLSVPGYYQLFYRTGEGIEVIHFEIVSELTE